MEKTEIKALAKSICKNAKPFGYDIKHSHMLEILARCDGAANFNTVAARVVQPVVAPQEVNLGCAKDLDPANVFGQSFWIGNVGVALAYCGEGLNGDYNPEDDEDEPLLRLDFMQLDEAGDFEEIDGSGCTQINRDRATLEQRQCFLEMALAYALKHVANRDDVSFKWITGKLTWLDETWDGRTLAHYEMPAEIPAIAKKYNQPDLTMKVEPVAPAIGDADVKDPEARVRTTATKGEWTTWRISQNLTDRWGEINEAQASAKPLIPLADESTGLLASLQAQMWDELTFIVRKDGQYGILFESEYCSTESEEHLHRDNPDDAWYLGLKSHEELVKVLLAMVARLEPQYPGVQFALADEQFMPNNRAAIWAFAPDGLLTAEQRESLGMALLNG